MRSTRKVLALMLIFVMAVMVSACGGEKDGTLSKSEYKKKIETLYNDMSVKAEAYATASTLAATDPVKALEDMKVAMEEMKPICEELGALKAPKEYADQQVKVKAGADASIELVKYSVEIIELSTAEAPDQEKLLEKTTEMDEKMAGWTTATTDLDTVVAEILK